MFREYAGKSVVLALVFLTFLYDETSSECTQLTPCSCILPDGHGYNLTQLNTSGPFMAPSSNNQTFYFHPCTNIQMTNVTTSECYLGKGVSMCLTDGKKIISLGTVEETTLNILEKTNSLVLRHKNYVTTVRLLCCDNCTSHLLAEPTVNEFNYNLLMVSPFVCKQQLRSNHGLSTGSLLLIYFFVFTGLYFVGGAIALNLIRGATGLEMIPNYSFWSDLPSLVREGIDYTFCASGSSNGNSYGRI